jgi:hypothetical protein
MATRQTRRAPEYKSWDSMKQRCLNARAPNYPRYGGRGVQICQAWVDSYAQFLADMGRRPAGTSLDRINNEGNYEPGNCRWATPSQQNENRKCGGPKWRFDFNGQALTADELAKLTGLSAKTLYRRLVTLKWPVDVAVLPVARGIKLSARRATLEEAA